MIPMIDLVFLLLIFFVLTFRFIIPEGDFNIQMASDAGGNNLLEINTDSVLIRLLADDAGHLAAIQLNGEDIEHFEQLRQQVRAIRVMHDLAGIPALTDELESTLFPDDHLRYGYVVRTITAVYESSSNIQFVRKIGGND